MDELEIAEAMGVKEIAIEAARNLLSLCVAPEIITKDVKIKLEDILELA